MLERKDVRMKLDHDVHAAAKAIAETEGLDIAEWVETVIVGVVTKRVHNAVSVVSALKKAARSGRSGKTRDRTP